MIARHTALHALTGALLCLSYPTDAEALERLGLLAKRFLALPADAPEEEFWAIADHVRDVQFRLEFGLSLTD